MVENFTTYTEVDPNSHISLSGTDHIDFEAYRNEDARVYKDKGAGHFDDFEHLVDIRVVSTPDDTAIGMLWAVSNSVDDTKVWYTDDKEAISVDFLRDSGTNYLRLMGYEDFDRDQTTSFNLDTWYYLTIEKSGTSVTCKVYSDSDRTNLLLTLSITIIDRSFRYIFGCNTNNAGFDVTAVTDIENLNLQEQSTVPVAMHQTGHIISKITRG